MYQIIALHELQVTLRFIPSRRAASIAGLGGQVAKRRLWLAQHVVAPILLHSSIGTPLAMVCDCQI